MPTHTLILPFFIFDFIWAFIGYKYDQESILIKHKQNYLLALWYPQQKMIHVYFKDAVHLVWNVDEAHIRLCGWDI